MGSEIFIGIEVVLLVLLFVVNRTKKNRYKQGEIVLLSILFYALFALFYLHFKGVIYFEWIEHLKLSLLFVELQDRLNAYLDTIRYRFAFDFGNYVTLFASLAVVVLFIIVKFFLLLTEWIFSFFINGNSIPLLARPWFERIDKDVVIRSKYIYFGKVSKIFGVLLFLSSLVGLLFTQTAIIWPAYLPVVALLFLEIGFFLDSTQKEKAKIEVFVEESVSSIITHLDNLFEEYKKTFAEKLLADKKSSIVAEESLSSYMVKDPYLKYIYNNLQDNQVAVSDDYFKGLDDIVSGKFDNVVFSNAFDMHYGLYLKVLFDHAYFHNRRVAVLVLDDEEREKTLHWIDDLINAEVYSALTHKTFDYHLRAHHILVDSIENLLYDDDLHRHYDGFGYIVVLDIKNFIRKHHIYLNAFLNIYASSGSTKKKIIGFSNLPNAIETGFNNIFIQNSERTSEVKVKQNNIDQFYALVFQAEGKKSFQEYIGINQGHHIGNEVPLAYFAWERGINPIVISSEVSSIEEEIEALEASVAQRLFLNNDIQNVQRRFFYPLSKAHKLFVVDDANNLYQSIIKWKNYAVSKEMMIVVSSSCYLLRDYFASNFNLIMDESEWFMERFPKGKLSHRERVYLLLAKLSFMPVARDEIVLPNGALVSKENISRLFFEYLGVTIEPTTIHASFQTMFDGKTYQEKLFYTVPYNRYDTVNPYQFYYTFENVHQEPLGICLEDDIYHKYIEGMEIVLQGMVYKILKIDKSTRKIDIESRRTVQTSMYDVKKEITILRHGQTDETIVQDCQIGTVHYKANVITLGYRCDFVAFKRRCDAHKVNKTKNLSVAYRNRETLRIEYRAQESLFNDKMRLAMEYLFYGILQSIFPDMHHLLSVRIVTEENREIFTPISESTDSKTIVIYIFETGKLDYHLLSTIMEYYDDILMLMQDFIVWSKASNTPMRTIGFYDMIEDMDFDSLNEFIGMILGGRNSITQSRTGENVVNTQREVVRVCDFCAAPLPIDQYETLSDGRLRCEKCKNQSVEYLGHSYDDLVDSAVAYLEKRYDITIDQRLKVYVVSSETLMEKLGTPFQPTPGFDARAVGLAVDADENHKEIYIENAAPKFRAMATIVHELTHIWQYHNLDFDKMGHDKIKIEGQAQWVELTYVEEVYPKEKRFVEIEKSRTDEYGEGYRYVERLLKNSQNDSLISIFSGSTKGNPFVVYKNKFGT